MAKSKTHIEGATPEPGTEIHEHIVFEGAESVLLQDPVKASALQDIAVDPNRPLLERVEAFSDIIDAEVGDTDLTRARNIERATDFHQLYLKFEGGNPSGTQKDRIAFAQVNDAIRREFSCLTLATCGNYGAAMAIAANLAGIRCVIYIPEKYHSQRTQEMYNLGAEIERVQGDYETAIEVSRRASHQNEWYDANPGGDNTALQLSAYGKIADEIYDELRDAPAVVAVPVSNGTLLAGIYRGFASLHRRGKISRIPRLVAGSTLRQNPIVAAWLSGAERCEDLPADKIRETKINEPLVNWHSIDGDLALSAVRETGGWCAFGADRALQDASRMLRKTQGLSVLPASTAGLHALLTRHAQDPLPSDRYVAVLTGRKP